jgi:hypothetical protein
MFFKLSHATARVKTKSVPISSFMPVSWSMSKLDCLQPTPCGKTRFTFCLRCSSWFVATWTTNLASTSTSHDPPARGVCGRVSVVSAYPSRQASHRPGLPLDVRRPDEQNGPCRYIYPAHVRTCTEIRGYIDETAKGTWWALDASNVSSAPGKFLKAADYWYIPPASQNSWWRHFLAAKASSWCRWTDLDCFFFLSREFTFGNRQLLQKTTLELQPECLWEFQKPKLDWMGIVVWPINVYWRLPKYF